MNIERDQPFVYDYPVDIIPDHHIEIQKSRNAYQEFHDSFLPLLIALLPTLSVRQREVFKLYYHFKLTQLEVSLVLKIAQPTVSQHLFGKKRNGKKVGGAIKKLQKGILKSKELTSKRFVQILKSSNRYSFYKNLKKDSDYFVN